jgi:hypothetical protein
MKRLALVVSYILLIPFAASVNLSGCDAMAFTAYGGHANVGGRGSTAFKDLKVDFGAVGDGTTGRHNRRSEWY